MDSYQLRYALITKLPIFTAVCAADQLRKVKAGKHFAIIVNNQPSTKEGMHWVCFYKAKDSKEIEFFDSFGLGIHYYPKSLFNFCRKNGKIIHQTKYQYQSNLSDVCGNFCVWFLLNRHKHHNIKKTLAALSSSELLKNDKLVKEFTDKKFSFPKFLDCKAECKSLSKKKQLPFSEVCYQKAKRCIRLQGKLYEA
jgi:hypothetical protein